MAGMTSITGTADAATIAENLARVRERMARAAERAGRRVEEITPIAVSKTFPAEAVRAAYHLGVRDFGENRVQEWEAKSVALGDLRDATWHLIGHLQSNKARKAAHLFHRVDSVDSVELARKLDAAAREEGKRLGVLIEVHLGGEESKSGVATAELPALTEAILPLSNLELRGLMAVPPYAGNPEDVRSHFRQLRDRRDDLQRRIGRELPVLSVGMSHDFEVAIEEGATEIRVGTGIFGTRKNL
jgi:pyridoxal phosphate enzyme (YggS family)